MDVLSQGLVLHGLPMGWKANRWTLRRSLSDSEYPMFSLLEGCHRVPDQGLDRNRNVWSPRCFGKEPCRSPNYRVDPGSKPHCGYGGLVPTAMTCMVERDSV